MRVEFAKMHGLGNDFMVIDAAQAPPPGAAQVRAWADRRTGVGFDQLLLFKRAARATFACRVFNADGSEVGQCGNGMRCVAARIWQSGLAPAGRLSLRAGGRVMRARPVAPDRVAVEMDAPRFAPADIPLRARARRRAYAVPSDAAGRRFGAVSVGNPHAVCAVDAWRGAAALAARLQQDAALFPEGVNVGFMRVENRRSLRLRVFERGSGETPACGSGACAAAAVGRLWGLLDAIVEVRMPGGELTVEWPGEGKPIVLTGEAVRVYEGVVDV